MIIGMFLLSGATALGISNKNDCTTLQVTTTYPSPIVTPIELDTEPFVKLSLEGTYGMLHTPGEPLLPQHIQTFELPFGTTITDISCTVTDVQSFSLSHKILPSPKASIL